jgi:primosomal protein N' (replication factor Y)
MNSIVRVVVNIPGLKNLYDYEVPEPFSGIQKGSLIVVPFGSLRAQAVVVEENCISEIKNRKQVLGILDAEPVLNTGQLALAAWMAEKFYASISDCVHLMLPSGMNQLADVLYSIKRQATNEDVLTNLQRRILDEINRRGAMRARQIRAAFSQENWKASIQALLRKGLIESKTVLPDPRVHRKSIRTAQIVRSPADVESDQKKLRKAGSPAFDRRKAALDFLLGEGIPVNVAWVYAASGANATDLKILEEKGFVQLSEMEIWRDPLDHIEVSPAIPPELTAAQHSAWKKIEENLKFDSTHNPIMIHGVTGSGKTELYLRAVEFTIQQGKQAIVLVPEISLTPQTVKRFMARFPGQVGLVHSRLSIGERYDTWRRARMGKIPILIGPRSALFAPLPNLGLIVIDEFHDPSFYQLENAPIYDAVQTALAYAQLSNCPIVLGSATPDISLFFKAQSEGWSIIHMPDRILAHQEYIRHKTIQYNQPLPAIQKEGKTAAALPLPLVQVVDMRNELRQGNRSIFSRSLQAALRGVLTSEQQAILFLNRRGSATYVFCRNCGKVLVCPRCELPLTLHEDMGKLICHICGYTRLVPQKCPTCEQDQIRQYGSGTQKVEKELSLLFPDARIIRWDADTARQKGAEELLLSHFANHHADFLIGTQMLAKGLDLPLVTLVGIVLADVGLNFPDYRAAERSLQVLTQVAGRSGRSPLGGHVILQTYLPDNHVIQRVARHDFSGFYTDEIIHRRQFAYPHFSQLIKLEFRHHDQDMANKRANELFLEIKQRQIDDQKYTNIIVSGPVPPFYSKERGLYRQQIILRGKDLHSILNGLPLEDWRVELNPPDLL